MHRLVELEERLARDADGAVRDAISSDLAAARARVLERLARGGSPEQYRNWSAAERALAAAQHIIAKIVVEPPDDRIAGPAVNLKGE